MHFPSSVLPDPISPEIARLLPRRSSRLTPSFDRNPHLATGRRPSKVTFHAASVRAERDRLRSRRSSPTRWSRCQEIRVNANNRFVCKVFLECRAGRTDTCLKFLSRGGIDGNHNDYWIDFEPQRDDGLVSVANQHGFRGYLDDGGKECRRAAGARG